MKGRVGFRRRQEFMKPSHFFIPTGSVSDPDPYWIRIQKWLTKLEKIKKISCFEVLDVLFGELKASFVTCR